MKAMEKGGRRKPGGRKGGGETRYPLGLEHPGEGAGKTCDRKKTDDDARKETGHAADWVIRGRMMQGGQRPGTGPSGEGGPLEKRSRSAAEGESAREAAAPRTGSSGGPGRPSLTGAGEGLTRGKKEEEGSDLRRSGWSWRKKRPAGKQGGQGGVRRISLEGASDTWPWDEKNGVGQAGEKGT